MRQFFMKPIWGGQLGELSRPYLSARLQYAAARGICTGLFAKRLAYSFCRFAGKKIDRGTRLVTIAPLLCRMSRYSCLHGQITHNWRHRAAWIARYFRGEEFRIEINGGFFVNGAPCNTYKYAESG